jgi:hypothetical protein
VVYYTFSFTFTVYNEFIGLNDNVIHISAYKAIIRQYTLTIVHRLLNCVLYEFIYYNITTIITVSDFCDN